MLQCYMPGPNLYPLLQALKDHVIYVPRQFVKVCLLYFFGSDSVQRSTLLDKPNHSLAKEKHMICNKRQIDSYRKEPMLKDREGH